MCSGVTNIQHLPIIFNKNVNLLVNQFSVFLIKINTLFYSLN